MIIGLLVASLCTFLAGALVSFAIPDRLGAARAAGPAAVVAGSLPGIAASVLVFFSGPVKSTVIPWDMMSGGLVLGMDPLSALFTIPILLVSSLAAVYSTGYLDRPAGQGRHRAKYWGFFNLLAGGMLLVTVSRNALLFLLGWEVMAIASFFLVMHEAEEGEVRRSGWIYLVATHLGTACLLALFAILGRGGSLDFERLALPAAGTAGAAFVLAFAGFGTKAGFVPFHVWLPEAHPSAPSGVSAVMSGVMIKTGIYGLLRFLLFLGPPPPWWGWVLLLSGMVSALVGVLSAIAQHDLKRLLAYHSVENIGIIGMGLGLGLLGISYGIPAMTFLGFAGGLFHVMNHALFKSLLFMGAGAVLKQTGTRELDHLGGLLRTMPVTGICFLAGSIAICGLPPFNGFASELLVYLSAFSGITAAAVPSHAGATAGLLAACGLALTGGLALACFTKAFGIVFLGEPRSVCAAKAGETPLSMRLPMMVLASLCLLLGLSGRFMAGFLRPVVSGLVTGFGGAAGPAGQPGEALAAAALVSGALILASAAIFLSRTAILRKRRNAVAPTWGCGFKSPAPSMQYTASSFAEPIVRLFGGILRRRRSFVEPDGLFPAESSFSTETPDVYQDGLYRPVFSALERVFSRFRVIQHGRVNLYILYIAAALFALLAWKL